MWWPLITVAKDACEPGLQTYDLLGTISLFSVVVLQYGFWPPDSNFLSHVGVHDVAINIYIQNVYTPARFRYGGRES